MNCDYRYQSGGSLPLDAPSYVARQADEDLFQSVLAGHYCYVLNSRQMGKSSLRVRTVDRLLEAGVNCVEIELLGIGSQEVTAAQWYGGMIQLLNSRLGLRVNRRQWMKEHDDLSPVQRLGTFIKEMVVPQLQQPLVIFFDEIDSVLGLKFPTEEFFGLIRNLYEQRARDLRYQQLTVVMLGVATPSDLMASDHLSTPFNIGRAIALQGFSLQEAQPLLPGLEDVFGEDNAQAGLAAILDWTGGQPFLTQKLCQLVQQHALEIEGCPEDVVEAIVRSHILTHWEAQDEPEHLRTIRNRLLLNAKDPARLLKFYQQLLKRGGVRIDSHSSEQIELRLSGLVTQRQGQIRVFNRVYEAVFDRDWVKQQLRKLTSESSPELESIQTEPLPLWQVPVWSAGVTAVVLVLQFLGWLQPLELAVFDRFMRWRPPEPRDDRLLVITVSEADIQYQDRVGYERKGSLADAALLRLLNKIEPYEPQAVGVDFYHEHYYQPDLLRAVTGPWQERFIAACEHGRTVDVAKPATIAAPPQLESAQVGFTDFAQDSDYVMRRHLIGMDGNAACPTQFSLSLRLALHYLEPQDLILAATDDQNIKLGAVALPKLTSVSGGYQIPMAEMEGHQLLINYRKNHPKKISLKPLLEGELDDELEELIRDRIILIGLDDAKDSHFTPMQANRIPGVVVHAHMTSQLISAVLDGRTLIRWLPNFLEIILIASVSLAGGWMIRWRYSHHLSLQLIGSGVILILLIGYAMLVLGIWLPVIPLLFVWAGSTLSLAARSQSSRH